ncbi:MAG: hypothetical protein DMD49_01415 [Gemmatimonadetes bacterium]|nr:MAG: hypothetical protein DMD49_01415 [Gemmatimonadota bacterium]
MRCGGGRRDGDLGPGPGEREGGGGADGGGAGGVRHLAGGRGRVRLRRHDAGRRARGLGQRL